MTVTEFTISEALAAVAYYAFIFAGSITMGYLFLRLTHPEVRTLPKKQKTRNAFLAGAGFLALTIAVDAVMNGFENVARVNSFTPLIASLLAGFTFVLFNLATNLKTRPLVVGVRIPKNRERVARGLAYVEEVIVKPVSAPPLVARELIEKVEKEKPAAGPMKTEKTEKSVHEKLEELKRAGVIRVEKPAVEKPALEKPVIEKPPVIEKLGEEKPLLAPATLAPATQAPTKPTAAPTTTLQVKKPGFFARLFGGKPKTKPKTLATTPPATPAKKEETEIEVIIKELGLVQEKPAVARAARAATTAPAAAAAKQTAPPSGERHRLYLHAKEAAEKQKTGGVSDQKEREEVSAFVKDVYAQLKAEQKPEGLREKVGVRQPKKELRERAREAREAKAAEEKPLSLADLLGTEKPTEAPTPAGAGAPASGLFAELEALAGGKKEEKKEEAKAGKKDKETELVFVKMQAPGVGCPTCHTKNTKIIFCPYCGTGLCANCATSIKTTPEAFIYTCPKCGEEITVKRKAVAAATAFRLG